MNASDSSQFLMIPFQSNLFPGVRAGAHSLNSEEVHSVDQILYQRGCFHDGVASQRWSCGGANQFTLRRIILVEKQAPADLFDGVGLEPFQSCVSPTPSNLGIP